MLRFDIPRVRANAARVDAFVTHVLCWLALLVSPWFMVVPLVQGAVRGFVGPHRCPSHRLWSLLLERTGHAGALEDAGPKMFAAKVLVVGGGATLARYAAGLPVWRVPCVVLLVFSFLEWALSFCAACQVYGAWYRRFPPSTP
jgi:hypothetical protein